jgi:4'-phosphopantetheinyl transferase
MLLRDIHLFSDAEILVLVVNYPEAESHTELLKKFLTSEEHLQAEKYHLSKPQKNFIVRRGLLKLLIGKLLEIEPVAVEIHCSPSGKPCCRFLQFNYSDSNDYLAFAFSKHHSLGIDIEFRDGRFDYSSIIDKIFSPSELEIFQALSPDEKQKAFFDLWTAKEAYLKYNGQGLLALQHVEYDITAPRKIKLKTVNAHYQPLNFDDNYSSALVTEHSITPVIHRLSFVE